MKWHRDNEITQTLLETQFKILGFAKHKFRDKNDKDMF